MEEIIYCNIAILNESLKFPLIATTWKGVNTEYEIW